jgi:CBS domain-containing protein
MFLQSASRGERKAERAQRMAPHVALHSAVQRTPQIVDVHDRVSDVMANVVSREFQPVVPVTENGTPIGFFTAADAGRFPTSDLGNLSVGSIIQRQQIYAVQLNDSAVDVLQKLQAFGARYALVLDGDAVVGVVGIPGLEALLRLTIPGEDAFSGRPPV